MWNLETLGYHGINLDLEILSDFILILSRNSQDSKILSELFRSFIIWNVIKAGWWYRNCQIDMLFVWQRSI